MGQPIGVRPWPLVVSEKTTYETTSLRRTMTPGVTPPKRLGGRPPKWSLEFLTLDRMQTNETRSDANQSGFPRVEAIGRNSNLGHLCKQWADLRKRIAESQARPPLLAQDASKPRSKRFLTTENVADIVARYEAGETTRQLGTRYGISKTRVGNVLREQSVAIRRQGLSDVQVDEAATLYTT